MHVSQMKYAAVLFIPGDSFTGQPKASAVAGRIEQVGGGGGTVVFGDRRHATSCSPDGKYGRCHRRLPGDPRGVNNTSLAQR